jgi:hypothetical protein
MHRLDGLQFQNDQPLDQNVRAESLVELNVVVNDGNRDLPLDVQTSLSQFVSQRDLVDGFQQTGTERFMDLEGAVHDDLSEFVFGHCVFLLALALGIPYLIWVGNISSARNNRFHAHQLF